ncbi:Uncharacterized protein SCF082_LOCUS13653 [Durusdinium trenchii]|uniref:Uncharacterized protein n=1 Tax=Durusdinium trenchii TaxID=1381693 RepID=A0ABP0JTY8_9DINO
MGSSKLPKLQLPKDEVAQRRIAEASELARAGELKAGQQRLKEAVSEGLFPAPLQRQVLAWWSAGEFDLLASKEVSEAKVAKAPVDDLEAQRSVEWDGEDWKFGEQ